MQSHFLAKSKRTEEQANAVNAKHYAYTVRPKTVIPSHCPNQQIRDRTERDMLSSK